METQKKVFISHSSVNREIVEQLSSYIEKIGVPSEEIFCSSIVSQGIDNGEKLGKAISSAIRQSRILIFVLSYNFLNSDYCMQELGIGWYLSEQGMVKNYYLVLPDIELKEINGFVNSNIDKLTFLDDDHRDDLGLFAENLCEELELQIPKHSVLSKNEHIFFNAIKDKTRSLIDRRNNIEEQKAEEDNEVQKLNEVIQEKDDYIEYLNGKIANEEENLRIAVLRNTKALIEYTVGSFGFSEGVSPQLFADISKEFWFGSIEKYNKVLDELNEKPTTDMEMMMATVYAAEGEEQKAYEHIKGFAQKMIAKNINVYPWEFKNFLLGYHGPVDELLELFEKAFQNAREGIIRDSYKDCMDFFRDYGINQGTSD